MERNRCWGVWAVAAVLAVAAWAWAESPRAAAPADKGAAADSTASAAPMAKTQPASTKAPATQPAKDDRPRLAHIRLGGAVLNSPPGMSLFGEGGMTLREWLQRLAKARNDETVAAVALEVDEPAIDWAQALELSDAVRRLNEVKPVYAFITEGGTSHYLVASAGREVAIEPMGSLMIVGLGAELTFYRGTLNLLNIEPQMIQVGKFKGAAEPYDRTEPSAELSGEYNKILDDLYDQLLGQVARQRKLKLDQVRAAIDSGPFTGKSALACKFVDRCITRTEWQNDLTEKAAGKPANWIADYGQKPPTKVDLSNPFALIGALAGGKPEEIKDPCIAIINCDGMIVDGLGGESLFGGNMVGSRTLVKAFQEVADDARVKAVIFRIDSPGGSALASELIYQAVKACSAKKPVIASIAQTGASGGYYVAMGAKTIYADPCGLVGSIGVVSGKLALKGLMNKVGITTAEITRGANAGLNLSRPWDEREKEVMRKMAQQVYDVFTARVADSRGKKIKNVDQIAQGRIFTARQACANGMVDELGGLREVILAAQAAAGVEATHFITLPKPRSFLEMFGGGETSLGAGGAAEMLLLRRLAQHSPGLSHMLNLSLLLGQEKVLAVMPHHVTIRP